MAGISLGQKVRRSLPQRVIVVEDDAVLGLTIEETLTQSGVAHVTVCPTAACTVERLRGENYDAVVLDVHLADSDEGWEIAELVDALGDDNVRIVFQTGSPQDIPQDIRQLGPVLSKPYEPQELVEALKQKPQKGLLAALRRKRSK